LLRVARIRSRQHVGLLEIRITGRLGAKDLGRLERACAVCLTERQAPLTIELGGVTAIDPPARSFLARMRERGATISGDRPPPSLSDEHVSY
jgi:hypothetical protein